ncbi:hypothetical protein COCMIDRAFT_85317 [Bipolaris oryzae ATCC 44560]|uniref:Uncharacterized protein n=1 Tax=Bipolaris oryzae ATCC 44560 TaxID=930090 RepID=W6ZH28_COCMI|nr:uncharacterized protein COCMIDRAFT_85317 [Bipolaris oryzae ATCC 44560]EUC49208.1 hypothetical protein COCMIDRAFT_85317 [Bipolaris oryzae ATCC 44560]
MLSSNMTEHLSQPTRQRRSRAITPRSIPGTTQSLAQFEARLSVITSASAAKDLINTMRVIVQQGNRRRHLVEPRRQKIRDLVIGMENAEIQKLYEEFTRAHNERENRSTFRLPLLDRAHEDGDDAVNQDTADTRERPEMEAAHSLSHEIRNTGLEDGEMVEVAEDTLNTIAQALSSPDTITSRFAIKGTSPLPAPSPLLDSSSAPELAYTMYDQEDHGACTVVPIQNPRNFPLRRVQKVQADYYPSILMVAMWVHRNQFNEITQVTGDLDKGPVNHLIIHDPRIIKSLGLDEPPFDVINLQPSSRVHETYNIRILPGQNLEDLDSWVVGELVSARHAYLYWLDGRRCSDPKGPPTAAEARAIATETGRRALDVKMEFDAYWKMECGTGGKKVREKRAVYLGEDPEYPEGAEVRHFGNQWW